MVEPYFIVLPNLKNPIHYIQNHPVRIDQILEIGQVKDWHINFAEFISAQSSGFPIGNPDRVLGYANYQGTA